jgi:hypothetical protein
MSPFLDPADDLLAIRKGPFNALEMQQDPQFKGGNRDCFPNRKRLSAGRERPEFRSGGVELRMRVAVEDAEYMIISPLFARSSFGVRHKAKRVAARNLLGNLDFGGAEAVRPS